MVLSYFDFNISLRYFSLIVLYNYIHFKVKKINKIEKLRQIEKFQW